MHLQIAEQILTALDEGSTSNGRLHPDLCENLPAFFFGNIAPDFQIICNLPRIESHFYPIPPAEDDDAFGKMLTKYPDLQITTNLTREHAIFIAAYGAHLLLDLIWFNEILVPYFVKSKTLADRPHRRFIHFTVLAYLDQLAYDSLSPSTGQLLAAAAPKNWIPFGKTNDLIEWRDLVANQLVPGAATETAAIFAERLNMTPEAFAANLQDATWMEPNVFNIVPMDSIQAILKTAVPRSIQLLSDYLYPKH
ncbi:MAG: hypothetical protein DWQ04_31130 [Chloroflexi bacterium]|nr:MAG: hypothetical protein DWQ04_31130 [Chloroflexota bacterium]